MRLALDALDLKTKFQKKTIRGIDQACPTREITFDHLNEKAQQAVIIVGKATYQEWQIKFIGTPIFIMIYPPEETEENTTTCICEAIWIFGRFKAGINDRCSHCDPDKWDKTLSSGGEVKPTGFVNKTNKEREKCQEK